MAVKHVHYYYFELFMTNSIEFVYICTSNIEYNLFFLYILLNNKERN